MPVAIAAAGIGAGAAVYGASQQAGAVNSASKSAQRAQEEARVINAQNLTNTLTTVGPRLEGAGSTANSAVTGANNLSTAYLSNSAIAAGGALGTGYGAAGNDLRTGANAAGALINTGYGSAGQRLQQAGAEAQGYLATGRETAGAGVTNANALLQPYIDQGGRALGVVGDLSGANGVDAGRAAMGNFQASPAYQWNMDQGLRAIDAGASAKGMLVSGGTRRAEQTYGAGLASNEFGQYYNRLSGLATQGLAASGTAGSNIMAGAGRQGEFDRLSAANAVGTGNSLAQNDVGMGTALAGINTGLGSGLATLDTGLGTGLANIHNGLGTALSNNEMTTGGRLSSNEMNTGANISNLYTGNATAQAANQTGAANNTAQTLASAGTAQASIYGDQTKGVNNAINSGMNNYAYLQERERQNPLAPQMTPYNAGTTSYWNPAVPANAQQYMTAG
jgi:hypothetical protein